MHAFLDRPLAGEWPYLWLDATYLKQREGGRIVSVAAIIAVAANTDGRREIVGLHIGPSEAETFWSSFLKSLARRGLRGVKLVISDAHEGLKAAIRRVFGATLATLPRALDAQCSGLCAEDPAEHGGGRAAPGLPPAGSGPGQRRCCATSPTSCGRNGRSSRRSSTTARPTCCPISTSPSSTAARLHSTNPLERLNKEVKRRADVVGIFPNEASIIRLIGAVLLEQNDEWQLQHRYMQVEAMAELATHRRTQPIPGRSHAPAPEPRFTRSTAASNGMDAKRSAVAPLSSPAAAQRCAEGAGLCAGHVQQPGGESPLCNLMEVKHE